MRWTALTAPALLAGCLTAQEPNPEPLGIIFDHDEMVAAMQGRYLWDCTMGETISDETFRFVIARRVFDGENVLTLEEAGRDLVEEVTPEPDPAIDAEIFRLEDQSRLLIRPGGTADGGGMTESRLARFTEGSCTRGEQR